MTDPHLIAADLIELHGRCGQRFAALVAGVGPGQWHDGTPCSQWDVRTLVHHLLYEQRWVPPLFEGLTIEQVGDRFEGDLMGGEASAWPGLLASSIEQAHAAVAQPGALDRTVLVCFVEGSWQEYVMQLTDDLANHALDLSRANGLDVTVERGAVALLLPWAEAHAGLLAASGMIGSRIDAGPDAPDDVRLLGLLGRRA